MGKPPGLIEDFVSPEIDREKEQVEHGAGKAATNTVYIIIAVVMAILVLLVVVGLHIPTGG